MTKTAELNDLFDDWETQIGELSGFFVRDGIINEEKWNQTNPKILFIAKEPNHYECPHAGDFRLDWTTGHYKYQFARHIAQWAFGVINGFPNFREIHRREELYPEYLQKIAFMNIKKIGGGSTAIVQNLVSHLEAANHLYYLQRQIEIIDPEIIILGLSGIKELTRIIFPDLEEELEQCGYGVEVAKIKGRKIIDFYHPSNRLPGSAMYSLLQNVINSDIYSRL